MDIVEVELSQPEQEFKDKKVGLVVFGVIQIMEGGTTEGETRFMRHSHIEHGSQFVNENRDLFVQDCYAGADPNYRLPVRIITEHAWHSIFVRNMLIEAETNDELRRFIPDFTVISIPSFRGLPEIDGTNSATFILLNLDQNIT